MNAKDFLLSYQKATNRIDMIIEEVARLESQAEKITQALSPIAVSTSNVTDFSKSVDKLIEAKDRLSEEAEQLVVIKDNVKSAIDMLHNNLLWKIMYRRYIMLNSFEEIAVKENYDFQYIKNQHSTGVKIIQQFIDDGKIKCD